MKILQPMIVFCILTGLLVACEKTVSQGPGPEQCIPELPDQNVTYTNYVRNIVSNSCTASCHRGGSSEGPGDFTTYNGLLDYAERSAFMFRVLADNADMPQGNAPLPEPVRDSLGTWVSNCFPQ